MTKDEARMAVSVVVVSVAAVYAVNGLVNLGKDWYKFAKDKKAAKKEI